MLSCEILTNTENLKTMNKIILIIVVAVSLFGCSSKKSIVQSVEKSETRIESVSVIDTSKVESKVLEMIEIEFNDIVSDSVSLKLPLPQVEINKLSYIKKIRYSKFAKVNQQNAISVSKDSIFESKDIYSKDVKTKDYGWTNLIVIAGLALLAIVIIRFVL